MRSVWPTAISTEPLCTQLTPSSATGARRERRHPISVNLAQKRAVALDPLENNIGRLRDIPVNVVHGRYDRMCHLYQAEALVRALRDAGNNAVSYFVTTAGHSSFEPETDTRLRTIVNELPPMTSPETASLQ